MNTGRQVGLKEHLPVLVRVHLENPRDVLSFMEKLPNDKDMTRVTKEIAEYILRFEGQYAVDFARYGKGRDFDVNTPMIPIVKIGEREWMKIRNSRLDGDTSVFLNLPYDRESLNDLVGINGGLVSSEEQIEMGIRGGIQQEKGYWGGWGLSKDRFLLHGFRLDGGSLVKHQNYLENGRSRVFYNAWGKHVNANSPTQIDVEAGPANC